MSDQDYRDLLEVLYALRDQPELPSPRVLKLLSHAASWPEDWERGKTLQCQHSLSKIPPVTECEMGAGFWQRVILRK